MSKTDKSKHDISIAAIKRSANKPYDYKWTRFYESNSDFAFSEIKFDLAENELIVCSTIIDSENYSILTTQKIVTKEDGIEYVGDLLGAKDKLYGTFKGGTNNFYTFGRIELKSGEELKYFIETGKASMIMIYGVRTIIRTGKMSEKKILKIQ